jgi:ubiquitin-conjugating enzyme E2 variant
MGYFFFLLQLEHSEKGHCDMSVSMGLVDPDDIYLTEWQGSILGPHGVSFRLCFSLASMPVIRSL